MARGPRRLASAQYATSLRSRVAITAVVAAALAALVALAVSPTTSGARQADADWVAFVRDICSEACTVDAAVEETLDASSGRTLRAARSVGEGEAVLVVPRELILTPHDLSPAAQKDDIAPLHGLVLSLLDLINEVPVNATAASRAVALRWLAYSMPQACGKAGFAPAPLLACASLSRYPASARQASGVSALLRQQPEHLALQHRVAARSEPRS
jgi:hypothetical protein